MIDIFELSIKVLNRLPNLDYENIGGNSKERLIFPTKFQINTKVERISEQELRFLFVEEFLKKYPDLFYSIETPTKKKYRFGKTVNDHLTEEGRSASHDMCVYKRDLNEYYRILNIEFKFKNSIEKYTSKDILKLIHEDQDGALVYLIKNTDKETLNSIFEKLKRAFVVYKETKWLNKDKSIQLAILSYDQKKLIYFNIKSLTDLDIIFKADSKNINDFVGAEGWEYYSYINENC